MRRKDRGVSPEQIRWSVDGQQYFQVNSSQFDATTWATATQHGIFLILNVAMGGDFPNGVAGTTTPTADRAGPPHARGQCCGVEPRLTPVHLTLSQAT